jgi:hypothetical protein
MRHMLTTTFYLRVCIDEAKAVLGQHQRDFSGRALHATCGRHLQDLPIHGVPATVELRSGRWKCRNELRRRLRFYLMLLSLNRGRFMPVAVIVDCCNYIVEQSFTL